MQKRRFRNADAATPSWNATAQKQCAALGLMCPTLRKKLSKRASELASKLPSMQPASELASLQPSELATELATEQTGEQSQLAGDAGRLGEESEEDSGGYCAADYAGYVWSHCVH